MKKRGRKEEDVFYRFFDRIDFDGSIPKIQPSLGRCWEWTGPTNNWGYINFWYKGEYHRAHRFAYWLFKGNLINGLQVEHLCNNKICVNPDHLDQVTASTNTNRAINDGLRKAGNNFSWYRPVERDL